MKGMAVVGVVCGRGFFAEVSGFSASRGRGSLTRCPTHLGAQRNNGPLCVFGIDATPMTSSPLTARFSVVVAHAPDYGIGRANKLLYEDADSRADLTHFRAVTSHVLAPGRQHAVIMGYNTFESLDHKPLRKRVNIVVTRAHARRVRPVNEDFDADAPLHVAHSLDAALELAAALPTVDRVFVIGGSQVFAAVAAGGLAAAGCDYAYVTCIAGPCVHCGARHTGACAERADTTYSSGATAFVAPFWLDASWEALFALPLSAHSTCTIYGAPSRPARVAPAPGAPLPLADAALAYRWPVGGGVADGGVGLDHDEYQYLRLVADVLARGERRSNRTGVPTVSVFGAQLRFALTDGTLPLLTTKHVPFGAVAKELLLLFVAGATDNTVLTTTNVHIWTANAEARAAARAGAGGETAASDLGPIYGFQWRHFGAPYTTAAADYTGAGVDQLAQLVHDLRADPFSRRHILCAWNPAQQRDMALPPCHVMAQFFVSASNGLTCMLTQRSADIGLGLPFNIASYALLTHLLARATGLLAEQLVVSLGDAHVYATHEGALLEQLSRRPKPFPKLGFAEGAPTDIFAVRPEHVTVVGYEHASKLAMAMAV